MSYDNGHQAPPTPGGYRAPSYAPPTPVVSHQPAYEQHSSYSSGGDAYYGVYPSSMSSKKKNTRASQACDQCRQLKAKCDETKPCKTCRDKGTECRYRDPVPKATDKAQADILDGINSVQVTLSRMMDHLSQVETRLTKIEGSFKPNDRHSLSMKPEPTGDDIKSPTPFQHHPNNESNAESYYPDTSRRSHVVSIDDDPADIGPANDDVDPGPPVPPGEPAIPINHTTLASLLLDWPAINELVKPHLESSGVRFVSEFPIGMEQNRGFLIVHGRGEDSHRSRAVQVPPDHGTIMEVPDDASDVASPSPAADYGQLGGFSPPDQIEYKGGVLGVDGNPDFNVSKVWALVDSFKENILNMHPIVQPATLDTWVQSFLDQLPVIQPRQVKMSSSKTFAVGGILQPSNEVPGSKRKRSPGLDDGMGPSAPTKAGRPDRSVLSAIVLTVLALGKICMHRDNIPDVIHPPDTGSHGSPMTRNGVPPSPSQGSPPGYSTHSHSSGLPSPRDQERSLHSRRSSIHGSGGVRIGYQLKKNYEVIPGLEYFAYATDILGNHTGAYNSMRDIYANIFAGLYLGQLARPMESFAFIHKASHKLQVIMRPSLNRLQRIKAEHKLMDDEDQRYNQLALTFWTCLQLESDLIAELQLPPSGLLSYEDGMPHPNMSLLKGFDQRVLDSYPGQLYLRTHLNSIHRMFYSPDGQNNKNKDKDMFKDVGLVSDAVSGMRWVAPSFAFREDDPPAADILSARLRAKYWGAQVITYRPFIRQILEFSYRIKDNTRPKTELKSEFREGIIAPVIDPNARAPSDIDPQVLDLAKKGIKALIESTRAFHGLDDRRPIITNVFGTAHAQWGNLLVLSAAFRDPILHSEVDRELLRDLFVKTIRFFHQSATATSSLRTDMLILEGLHTDLFQHSEPRMNSSFSSSTSTLTPKMPPMAAPPHHTKLPYSQ
jgi:hypothetical protein